jgi:hypothetical protein
MELAATETTRKMIEGQKIQELGKNPLFLPSGNWMAGFMAMDGVNIVDLGETDSVVRECHPLRDWTAIRTELDGLVPESEIHLRTLLDCFRRGRIWAYHNLLEH